MATSENGVRIAGKGDQSIERVHTDKNSELPQSSGYRDKRTGVCYFNTPQQTDGSRKERREPIPKYTRETQLCEKRNQCWNTTRETWTQMDRCNLLLDSSHDYIMYPGCYKDSKLWEDRQNRAAIVIQQYARRWSARRKAMKLRKYAQEKSELFAEQEKNQKVKEELQLKQEIHKHRHPHTKTDFEVLYKELEMWHLQELRSIKGKGLEHNEQKLALQELLQKESKFLQAIDKMKLMAAKENREERIKMMMCRMSALKSWQLSDGRLVHVQTLATQRASDLMRLYTALAKCSRTVDERMCVLGYIKWTVQEFHCPLTEELVQLIEREADLMYRNRPTESLLGLRKRILELFLKFIQVPQFNPEAAAHQYVPIDFDHVSHQSMRRQSAPNYLVTS